MELAFSWLAAQSVVSSVIAGATRPEQIAANVKAADWALTADELAEIDRITAWSRGLAAFSGRAARQSCAACANGSSSRPS